MGEEHRRPGVSVEHALASTWLLRAGVVAIVVAIGFFLKWSFDRGLLGPEGGTAISIFAGLAMIAAGVRLCGRRYRLLGQASSAAAWQP